MIDISQNVTKVKKELVRVVIGAGLLLPVAAVFCLMSFLVQQGYITTETVSSIFFTVSILFLLWTLGGAFESIQDFRKVQEEHKKQQTDRAFDKLAGKKYNGNT